MTAMAAWSFSSLRSTHLERAQLATSTEGEAAEGKAAKGKAANSVVAALRRSFTRFKQTEERDRSLDLVLTLFGTLIGAATLIVSILAITGSLGGGGGGGGGSMVVVNMTDGTVVVTMSANETLSPTHPPPGAPPQLPR